MTIQPETQSSAHDVTAGRRCSLAHSGTRRLSALDNRGKRFACDGCSFIYSRATVIAGASTFPSAHPGVTRSNTDLAIKSDPLPREFIDRSSMDGAILATGSAIDDIESPSLTRSDGRSTYEKIYDASGAVHPRHLHPAPMVGTPADFEPGEPPVSKAREEPMTIINDTNRRLVSDIFDVIGSRPLSRIGEACPPMFEARDAGLVSFGTASSADPTWSWEITIDDLLILAGTAWATEARQEAIRMIDVLARAVAQGHGQATDDEREAAHVDRSVVVVNDGVGIRVSSQTAKVTIGTIKVKSGVGIILD